MGLALLGRVGSEARPQLWCFTPSSDTVKAVGQPGEGWCLGLGLGGWKLKPGVGAQEGLGSFAGPGGLWEVLAQVRVRELEEQCRSQTERFSLLAQELQAFRLHPGPLDLLTSALGYSTLGDHPPPPCCCSTPHPCRGSGPKGKWTPVTFCLECFCVEQRLQGQRKRTTHPKSHGKLGPGWNKALMGEK